MDFTDYHGTELVINVHLVSLVNLPKTNCQPRFRAAIPALLKSWIEYRISMGSPKVVWFFTPVMGFLSRGQSRAAGDSASTKAILCRGTVGTHSGRGLAQPVEIGTPTK